MSKEEKKPMGGARAGAGRKTKADEDKVNVIMLSALKQLYKADTDDEAKIEFVKKGLLTSQRGQIFVAEHVFGKPKETIEQVNLNIDQKDLTLDEIKKIKEALNESY